MDEDQFSTLDRAFTGVLRPWVSRDAPVTLLFSGGVDSGLLAWELRHNPSVTLLTVGVHGSTDLRDADESARLIGARWVRSEVTASEVRDVARHVREQVRGLSRTPRNVLVAFAMALDRAPDEGVLCGQGADELFLGYRHFRGLTAAEASDRSEFDLALLRDRDWPRARQIAESMGRTAFAPYLEPTFIEEAQAVPIDRRLPGSNPKAFFRQWAEHRGLPASIATRPKRALQYGSGIDRLVPESTGDDLE
jgi:asparagine synthase (glutamine-hydrolysing)